MNKDKGYPELLGPIPQNGASDLQLALHFRVGQPFVDIGELVPDRLADI